MIQWHLFEAWFFPILQQTNIALVLPWISCGSTRTAQTGLRRNRVAHNLIVLLTLASMNRDCVNSHYGSLYGFFHLEDVRTPSDGDADAGDRFQSFNRFAPICYALTKDFSFQSRLSADTLARSRTRDTFPGQFGATQPVKIDGVSCITGSQDSPRSRVAYSAPLPLMRASNP